MCDCRVCSLELLYPDDINTVIKDVFEHMMEKKMPNVLCYNCGHWFEVEYDTKHPSQKCPKCLDKMRNKIDAPDDLWKDK